MSHSNVPSIPGPDPDPVPFPTPPSQTPMASTYGPPLPQELHFEHDVPAPYPVASAPVLGEPVNFPETPSMSAGASSKSRDQSVSSACLGCRSKHLKCDGQSPCSRCVSAGFGAECTYIASRRGYKGPRRAHVQNPNKRMATSPPDSDSASVNCPMLLGASGSSGGAPTPNFMVADGASRHGVLSQCSNSTQQLYRSYCEAGGVVEHYPSSVSAAHVPVQTFEERCMDSYFRCFHVAHPFVLPKEHLFEKAKDGTIAPLLSAISWAGSLYIEDRQPRKGMLDETLRLVQDQQRREDGFLLQAIMVLVVGLDGSCQNEKARELLGEAEALAVQLGLNTRPFATANGGGKAVMEESWRRTWWDLYMIDAMIAGVHQVTNFPLYDLHPDVALPCEEHQYLSGNIPPPMDLDDLEDRDFSGDDREVSSFGYRILCARNLGQFMRTPPITGPDDENLASVEALLTNWRLHLPDSKKHALDRSGRLDEMMFQATMMVHATSILLHQPHSQLDSSPARSIDSCAPHRAVVSGDMFNTHTKHTITSAVEISKLITHPVPLLSHTHFFTCVITLSSIVHLSRWALSFIPYDDDDLRQQIRLNIGALNQLAKVWSAADRARMQVKTVAQDIYKVKKQQQMNPQFWIGFSSEDIARSREADESIISEIEALHDGQSLLPLT